MELPPDASIPTSLPPSLLAAFPVHWSREDAPLARRLARALRDAAGEPVLAIAADTVVDARVIEHLFNSAGNIAFVDGEGAERGALLRLESEPAGLAADDEDLLALAERLIQTGAAKELAESDFDGYIVMLRRTLAPYLIRIPDAASRDRAEHFLFWSNYKGSTDFLTKHVYPPFVWRAVRPLARRRVHPNWVTSISWVATFAAVPLFATGAWIPGLLLAYLMSVFDSVDGKLARLTFTSTKVGEALDHGLDIVHPPVWYMAWGWWLGNGDVASAPFQASLWMFGFYVMDRLCAMAFKARTGCSIHGYTRLDERLRTFISRRNVNLAAFTVALLMDWTLPGYRIAEYTFYAIVAWQVLSLLWHAERVARFWNLPARS
ncbi:MAG: CDP-alcohol phosphatidyltransferase family protein [Myxococcales bacterium]|nr:CDP-alcohol phosphatidyltransferase family protein [Myxococcales bacterium]